MAGLKLVVVGGVAGGATAAARARRLNEQAEIVLFERGPYVSFANCGLPYHVGGEIAQREKLLLQTPEGLMNRYNIDVHVRSEVIEIDRNSQEVVVRKLADGTVYREHYDKLILSPGASPIRPPLPGADHERVFTLRNMPDMDRIKAAVDGGARQAVVVGGGFIGLEMAENLRRRGLSVHLVEMLDQVLPQMDKEMVEPLHQTLRSNGVELHLADAVEAFQADGPQMRVRLRRGEVLPADLVVLAAGIKPEADLAKRAGLDLTDRGAIRVNQHMQTSDPNIYAVGDAVSVRDFITGAEVMVPLAGPANRQGRIAADNVCGRHSVFRGCQGTSIVKVFNLAAGMTGSSEKTLRRAGVGYQKVHLHAAQHVGYFPGASMLAIKLLFSVPDGRVLGAQVVGAEGVDKRIDVIALAIQGGMTVFDLEEAELGYAPQFGSAKDPVNLAGFVAANTLRGDVEIIHADELNGQVLVDVRSPQEHQAGAIPGAQLIPLPELRDRHEELPRDRRVVVYCQVGMRGYLAARMLRQLGHDVRNLSGGVTLQPIAAFQAGRGGSLSVAR